MQWLATDQGFPLRDIPLLRMGLHDGLRQLAIASLLVLLVWALRAAATDPATRRERLAVLGGVLLSLLAVNLLKLRSLTSCPWDLIEFGGRARYVSHWVWGMPDGGAGRCFPGGHASSALAFVALAMPGLTRGRRSGWAWLGAVLLAGAVAGGAQTLRGAHYPSHTLWTLVVCLGSAIVAWTVLVHRPWLPAGRG